MNIFKKALCALSCVLIALSVCSAPAAAEQKLKEGPLMSVGSYSAVPLDNIIVNIDAAENPGIMAMTFTISYDPQAFEFVTHHAGLSEDIMIVDHPDKGYVSFVSCENFNKFYEGTLFSLEFKVKEKAAPGFYDMKIRNIRPEKNGDSMIGCFADWQTSKITPKIQNGGVTVGKTCSNSGHTFAAWKEAKAPLCKEPGFKTRSCSRCGHTQTEEIPMLGSHSYNDFWTIDREATSGQSGIMSRHCKVCSASTDKKNFTLSDSEKHGFSNTAQATVKEEDWSSLKLPEQSAPSAPSSPADTSDAASSDTPSEDIASSKEEIPDANAMVNDAKKETDGIGVKLYRYLFGDGDTPGIFEKIADALPDWLKNLSPFLVLLLVVVVIIIVVI